MASIYTMVDKRLTEMDMLWDEIEQLSFELEEAGALDDEAIKTLQDILEEKKKQLETLKAEAVAEVVDKIDDYGKWLKNVNADVESMKKEEQRIAKRRRGMERKADWIKENILFGMNSCSMAKVPGTLFTASVRNTPSLDVDEPAVLRPFKDLVEDFYSNFPSWLQFKPIILKSEAKKLDTLPEGITQVINQSLIIK